MLITCIIFLPLLTALLLMFIPRQIRVGIRLLALVATLATMLLSLLMFLRFQAGLPGYQFELKVPWVQEAIGISYHVGVDGINIGLLLMGAVVAFAAACVSWEIKTYEKEFYILLLVMAGGILGAFASLDLFFFCFFHELALVPTFIMIGIWGRGENKNYATFNITLYLSIGALITLVGLIALYLQLPANARSFDLVQLTNYFKGNSMPASTQYFIFPLLLFGFGILVSLWPFHTWAPLGYGAAPTPTAMLHAGALKKFERVLPVFGLPIGESGEHHCQRHGNADHCTHRAAAAECCEYHEHQQFAGKIGKSRQPATRKSRYHQNRSDKRQPSKKTAESVHVQRTRLLIKIATDPKAEGGEEAMRHHDEDRSGHTEQIEAGDAQENKSHVRDA